MSPYVHEDESTQPSVWAARNGPDFHAGPELLIAPIIRAAVCWFSSVCCWVFSCVRTCSATMLPRICLPTGFVGARRDGYCQRSCDDSARSSDWLFTSFMLDLTSERRRFFSGGFHLGDFEDRAVTMLGLKFSFFMLWGCYRLGIHVRHGDLWCRRGFVMFLSQVTVFTLLRCCHSLKPKDSPTWQKSGEKTVFFVFWATFTIVVSSTCRQLHKVHLINHLPYHRGSFLATQPLL